MVKPTILANTLTTVGIGLYVVCRILTLLVPDLIFSVGQSWVHTFSLETAKTAQPFDLGTFLLGGITFGALVWITTYSAAALYNKWANN